MVYQQPLLRIKRNTMSVLNMGTVTFHRSNDFPPMLLMETR